MSRVPSSRPNAVPNATLPSRSTPFELSRLDEVPQAFGIEGEDAAHRGAPPPIELLQIGIIQERRCGAHQCRTRPIPEDIVESAGGCLRRCGQSRRRRPWLPPAASGRALRPGATRRGAACGVGRRRTEKRFLRVSQPAQSPLGRGQECVGSSSCCSWRSCRSSCCGGGLVDGQRRFGASSRVCEGFPRSGKSGARCEAACRIQRRNRPPPQKWLCRAPQPAPGFAPASSGNGRDGRLSPFGPPATWSATKAPRSPMGRGGPAVVSSAVCSSSSALISAPSSTM